MVDVSKKEETRRTATATGKIYIPKIAYDLITQTTTPQSSQKSSGYSGAETRAEESAEDKGKAKVLSKGDVLTVAQLAAIMGCKRTSDLIPLCHPLQLSHVSVELFPMQWSEQESSKDKLTAAYMSSTGPQSDKPLTPRGENVTYSIMCRATVSCEGKTGVEMEALTAVSVGLLTVWDMLKAIAGKEMRISDVLVHSKQGGKSGDFVRDGG